jgi:hypothetical protein
VRGLVADDGAVALQRADGEDFVDHGFIVTSGAWDRVSLEWDVKIPTLFRRERESKDGAPGTCRGGFTGETIRAVMGRDCGEIPAAWISGSRS